VVLAYWPLYWYRVWRDKATGQGPVDLRASTDPAVTAATDVTTS